MTSPSPVSHPRCGMEKKMRTMTDVDETLSGRDWSELPQDALMSILGKFGALEILMGAGAVCHSWLEAAKVPDLWRSVDMTQHELLDVLDDQGRYTCDRKILQTNFEVLCAMARVAVDRSGGQLEAFHGKLFVNDELLKYIADRSPALKTLSIISCDGVSSQGFTHLIAKCPMLEDLKLVECINLRRRETYQAIAKACAQLKHFTLCNLPTLEFLLSRSSGEEADGVVAMHELRSLTLTNCNVTNNYLAAILDGCPHLEVLDLRLCIVIDIDPTLMARCAAIKSLRLPA
ncbi:hypothetical protein BDA96_07G074000 [Sorghum bicolor]|uniref:F-box domain-containing protein n=1 Tax=Sorghum bicolor TaxID=4558 RepID=A0A921QL57_SORBI|nr:hypothetical protein BDA96_07G074000 [Sorghum bicolor]